MQIGNLKLINPIFTAPMAGITDKAFREILKAMGSAVVFAEMVSDKALTYGNQHTLEMLDIAEDGPPVAVQIFGSEPQVMAEAARIVAAKGADLIDINMGCPAPKIVRNGEGSALMKNPQLAAEIVRAVVAAVDIPVTVKIRKGWDDQSTNALEVALLAEDAGAQAVTVHGRTRNQYYAGPADWAIIGDVKKHLQIPVIGNGDIWHPTDAQRMMAETGCDGVMIARGMLGNPWLVQRTVAVVSGEMDPGMPDSPVRLAMIKSHLDRVVVLKGEICAVQQMRKHVAWYIKGLRDAARIRTAVNHLSGRAEVLALLEDYFAKLAEEKKAGPKDDFCRLAGGSDEEDDCGR